MNKVLVLLSFMELNGMSARELLNADVIDVFQDGSFLLNQKRFLEYYYSLHDIEDEQVGKSKGPNMALYMRQFTLQDRELYKSLFEK